MSDTALKADTDHVVLNGDTRTAIAAAAIAADKTGTRPALAGIHVVSRGVDAGRELIVEATDSYRLHHAVLRRYTGPDIDAVIDAAWLASAAKALTERKGTTLPTLAIIDGRAVITGRVETRSIALIDTTTIPYPNTATIVDQVEAAIADRGFDIAVQPAYLRQLLTACELFGAWSSRPVTFRATDKMKPIKFVVDTGDATFTGMLMPVRMP